MLPQEFIDKVDRVLPDDKRYFGMKIILAGAESKTFRDGLYRVGVRNILISYFSLRNQLKKQGIAAIEDDLNRFDFVFLDSGGFSLLKKIRDEGGAGISVKEYAEEYYDFLKKTKDVWSVCAEVDVVDELGRAWMEEQKDDLLKHKVPIMPVIQGEKMEEIDEWGWFEKFPYIAIGSAVSDIQYTSLVNAYVQRARDTGVLLHGFGMTSDNVIRQVKFYSVDSTSWLGGGRFGTTMVFQNGRIRHFDKTQKDERKRFRLMLEENGIRWDLIVEDKATEVNNMNALAWRQYAQFISYNVRNAYWLTDEEKTLAKELRTKFFKATKIIDKEKNLALISDIQSKVVEASGDKNLPVLANNDARIYQVLYCDTCYLAGRCPRYEEGDVCSFGLPYKIVSKEGISASVEAILMIQLDRVMRGALFEKMEGGVLDKRVSNELSLYMKILQQLREIMDDRDTIQIKAKGHGVIKQIFGGGP